MDGPKPHDSHHDDVTVRYSVLSPKTIAAWAVLIVLVGVGVAAWLLVAYTGGDAEANRVQLEAIRTAGTVVVGTGGAAALLLAARRQRSTEIALKQKDREQRDAVRTHALQEQVAEQNRRHQERVAAATEADAEARRITDLYTKAVEQLGSDKAPVRLGGMYALERLAQDNESQRQTIVNVLCAYLRMPYTAPGDLPGDDDRPDAGEYVEDPAANVQLEQARNEYGNRVQELEVRTTAQRILATHLRPGPDTASPVGSFWDGIELDLTGATLVDLDFDRCHVRVARFTNARFIGQASFREVGFDGVADFKGVRFRTDAAFHEAQFVGGAEFDGAQFAGRAVFSDATFGRASFGNTRFAGQALFRKTHFTEPTWFHETQFDDAAEFRGARFAGTAGFGRATFSNHAEFREGSFMGTAEFDGTQFGDTAWFREVPFFGNARFGGATFNRNAHFDNARFSGAVKFSKAQFMGTAGFMGSHFTKAVTFDETHFDADAKFGRVIFLVNPSMQTSTFEQAVPPELAHFVHPGDADGEPPA